ncbi:hypothetical protein PVL29_020946 [Vitis rotundifolia]|uniref:Uncharacterized protein n=1 Tax=Vitis rotundifolia TaxID=103349 RepID=A0AA38YYN3_VITRO|nr:hypothetical protein PVL29_020946 [Vitis rotundifolia]
METTQMVGKEVSLFRDYGMRKTSWCCWRSPRGRKEMTGPFYDMDGFLEFREVVGEESQECQNRKDPSFSRRHERRCLWIFEKLGMELKASFITLEMSLTRRRKHNLETIYN